MRASADVWRMLVSMLLNGGCGYEDLRLYALCAFEHRLRPGFRLLNNPLLADGQGDVRPTISPGQEPTPSALRWPSQGSRPMRFRSRRSKSPDSGRPQGERDNRQYLHHGISARAFTHRFSLEDHVEVEQEPSTTASCRSICSVNPGSHEAAADRDRRRLPINRSTRLNRRVRGGSAARTALHDIGGTM